MVLASSLTVGDGDFALFDYETWKTIATSGGENVHYYTWSNGSSFQENGIGTAATFESITNGSV